MLVLVFSFSFSFSFRFRFGVRFALAPSVKGIHRNT